MTLLRAPCPNIESESDRALRQLAQWEHDTAEAKEDAVIAACRTRGVHNLGALQQVMQAIDQLGNHIPSEKICSETSAESYCQRRTRIREDLIRTLMHATSNTSGWYQYYRSASDADRKDQSSGLWFARRVATCSHDFDKMDQILLAIMTSDLAMLQAIWPNLDNDLNCREQENYQTLNLVMDAIYLTFNPQIFAYLEERLHFSQDERVVRRYLEMAVQYSQVEVFQALTELEGVSSDIYRRQSCTSRIERFRIACRKCQFATSLTDPAYQILILSLAFMRSSDRYDQGEMGAILGKQIIGGNDLLFFWCVNHQMATWLDPNLLVMYAWKTQNREMLLFGMKQLREQAKEANPKGTGLCPAWIVSVLGQVDLD